MEYKEDPKKREKFPPNNFPQATNDEKNLVLRICMPWQVGRARLKNSK